MKMESTAVKNAGYLLSLVPQLALVVGTYLNFPWLSVVVFFVVLPIVRSFVGNDKSPPNSQLSKWLEMYLHAVPRLYVLGWFIILVWTIWLLATVRMTAIGYVGFAMGLWIICSLNTAVAHELIHTRTAFDRSLGVLMDATVGYFHFAEEHLSHHARSGHAIDGDAAIPGESIYKYAWTRYWRSHRHASEYETSRLRRLGKKWWSNRLLHKSSITLVVALCFYQFAGWIGLAIYGFEIVGSAFTIQGITYLQH